VALDEYAGEDVAKDGGKGGLFASILKSAVDLGNFAVASYQANDDY